MIRHFRERAGISTRELARRTGVAASYVSKVELGQLGSQPRFCASAAKALGLARSDRQLLDALLALHRAEHHPVPSRSGVLRQAQQAVRRLERGSRSCRVFQLSLIPGLLQTRAYAEAIFERFAPTGRPSAAVSERLSRQKILEDPDRRFRFLISDWAFGPHWCSERVMRGQLQHLRKVWTRPNVDIRILPSSFRFPKNVPPLVTGFEIIDGAVVIVDTMNGFTTFRQTEEVAEYVEVFDEIFPGAARVNGPLLI